MKFVLVRLIQPNETFLSTRNTVSSHLIQLQIWSTLKKDKMHKPVLLAGRQTVRRHDLSEAQERNLPLPTALQTWSSVPLSPATSQKDGKCQKLLFRRAVTTVRLRVILFWPNAQRWETKLWSFQNLSNCFSLEVSLSLASVKSRLVLPFWHRLTWDIVPDKRPLNRCLFLFVFAQLYTKRHTFILLVLFTWITTDNSASGNLWGLGSIIFMGYLYRHSVDNTVEENSSISSLIWMCWLSSAKGMPPVKLCTNKIL